MTQLNNLYKPDGKALSVLITGKPGSGKSYFIKHTLLEFNKKWDDKAGRIVYICPKAEMDLGENTHCTADGLEKHLRKNRIAVIYPNPLYVEEEADFIIEQLFDIQQANPDFKCVVLVDDAQTFIQSRRASSPQFRRLALTGRSKNLRAVFVAHMMVFSKDLEGSVSYLVNFSMPVKLYWKDAAIRYGFDAEKYAADLANNEYSYVWHDVTKGQSTLFSPLEVKGNKIESQEIQTIKEPGSKEIV